MRVLIFIFYFLLIHCLASVAQPCSEDAKTKKGSWEKTADFNYFAPTVHPETKKNINAIKLLLDTIAGIFIRSNPRPVGASAEWQRYLEAEKDSVTSPDPSFTNYQFVASFYPFICSKGVVKPFSQTDIWLYVHVNGYWPSGHTLQHEINKTLGEKLFTLPPRKGVLNGYPLFEPIPRGEKDNPKLFFYSVLIHQPGKFPYLPVTRAEFFALNKKLIDQKEKEYQQGLEFQRNRQGEEWYRKESERVRKQFQATRDNLNKLEKAYAAELNEPVYLKTWEWTLRSVEIANPANKDIFVSPSEGFQLVRSNPDYVNKNKARWKPQFIWIKWYKPVGNPAAIELDNLLKNQFDFSKLGKLLN